MERNKEYIGQELKSERDYNYSLIAYYGKNDKDNGIIYNGNYSQAQLEQATVLVQNINKCLDLLNQVIQGREFERGYFNEAIKR